MKHGWPLQFLTAVGLSAVCLALRAGAQEVPPPSQPPTQPPTDKPPPKQAPPPEEASGEPAAGAKVNQGPEQAPRTPRQPSAEDIIREFQKQRPTVVPVLPSGGEDEVSVRGESQAKTRPRLPDGYMLMDRSGRIAQEGPWWVFAFESDSGTHPEPPMKLLPNQALERMVRESRGGLEPIVFVVTGEVTDFRGENYLLPRKVLRKRDLGNLRN